MNPTLIFFLILAAVSVASALGLLFSRSAVYAALFLVLNFLTIAVFYLMLNAPFLALAQITVYAGAIMVFFLFVTMFLGKVKRTATRPNPVLYGVALVTVIAISWTMVTLLAGTQVAFPEVGERHGTIEAVSELLLSEYIFPFELTGLLLTVAVIGAVMLARREAPGSRGARLSSPRTPVARADEGVAGGASDA